MEQLIIKLEDAEVSPAIPEQKQEADLGLTIRLEDAPAPVKEKLSTAPLDKLSAYTELSIEPQGPPKPGEVMGESVDSEPERSPHSVLQAGLKAMDDRAWQDQQDAMARKDLAPSDKALAQEELYMALRGDERAPEWASKFLKGDYEPDYNTIGAIETLGQVTGSLLASGAQRVTGGIRSLTNLTHRMAKVLVPEPLEIFAEAGIRQTAEPTALEQDLENYMFQAQVDELSKGNVTSAYLLSMAQQSGALAVDLYTMGKFLRAGKYASQGTSALSVVLRSLRAGGAVGAYNFLTQGSETKERLWIGATASLASTLGGLSALLPTNYAAILGDFASGLGVDLADPMTLEEVDQLSQRLGASDPELAKHAVGMVMARRVFGNVIPTIGTRSYKHTARQVNSELAKAFYEPGSEFIGAADDTRVRIPGQPELTADELRVLFDKQREAGRTVDSTLIDGQAEELQVHTDDQATVIYRMADGSFKISSSDGFEQRVLADGRILSRGIGDVEAMDNAANTYFGLLPDEVFLKLSAEADEIAEKSGIEYTLDQHLEALGPEKLQEIITEYRNPTGPELPVKLEDDLLNAEIEALEKAGTVLEANEKARSELQAKLEKLDAELKALPEEDAEARPDEALPEEPGERAELIRELIGKYDNEEIREGLGNPKDVPIEQLRRFLRPIDEETAKALSASPEQAKRQQLEAQRAELLEKLAGIVDPELPDVAPSEMVAALKRIRTDQETFADLEALADISPAARGRLEELAREAMGDPDATFDGMSPKKVVQAVLANNDGRRYSMHASKRFTVANYKFLVATANELAQTFPKVSNEQLRARAREVEIKHGLSSIEELNKALLSSNDAVEQAILVRIVGERRMREVANRLMYLRRLDENGTATAEERQTMQALTTEYFAIRNGEEKLKNRFGRALQSLKMEVDEGATPLAELTKLVSQISRPESLGGRIGETIREFQRTNLLATGTRGIDLMAGALFAMRRALAMRLARLHGLSPYAAERMRHFRHDAWLAAGDMMKEMMYQYLDGFEKGGFIDAWHQMDQVHPMHGEQKDQLVERGETRVVRKDSRELRKLLQQAVDEYKTRKGRKALKGLSPDKMIEETSKVMQEARKSKDPARYLYMMTMAKPTLRMVLKAYDQVTYGLHTVAFGPMKFGDMIGHIEFQTTAARDAAQLAERRVKAGLLPAENRDQLVHQIVRACLLRKRLGKLTDADYHRIIQSQDIAHLKRDVDQVYHVAMRWQGNSIAQPGMKYTGDSPSEKFARGIGGILNKANKVNNYLLATGLGLWAAVDSTTGIHAGASVLGLQASLLFMRTATSLGADVVLDNWLGVRMRPAYREAVRTGNKAEQAELKAFADLGMGVLMAGFGGQALGIYEGPLSPAEEATSAETGRQGSSWDLDAMLNFVLPEALHLSGDVNWNWSRFEPFSNQADAGAQFVQMYKLADRLFHNEMSSMKVDGKPVRDTWDASNEFGRILLIFKAMRLEDSKGNKPLYSEFSKKTSQFVNNLLLDQGAGKPLHAFFSGLADPGSGVMQQLSSGFWTSLLYGQGVFKFLGRKGKRFESFPNVSGMSDAWGKYSHDVKNFLSLNGLLFEPTNKTLAPRLAPTGVQSRYPSSWVHQLAYGAGLAVNVEDTPPWLNYMQDYAVSPPRISEKLQSGGVTVALKPDEYLRFVEYAVQHQGDIDNEMTEELAEAKANAKWSPHDKARTLGQRLGELWGDITDDFIDANQDIALRFEYADRTEAASVYALDTPRQKAAEKRQLEIEKEYEQITGKKLNE
jgi:hypothetical protein